jgi:hypothetical protein
MKCEVYFAMIRHLRSPPVIFPGLPFQRHDAQIIIVRDSACRTVQPGFRSERAATIRRIIATKRC